MKKEEIIYYTLVAYQDIYRMIEEGRYLDAKEYVVDAHSALRQMQDKEKEEALCLETLKKKLVSEGTILLMPKVGNASSVRNPQPPMMS